MLAAFAVAVLASIAAAGIQLGGAVVARHRAQAAADLAALAAAGALPAGGQAACARAGDIAAAMGASITDCRIDGLDVVIDAQITVGVGAARAVARAGPAM